MSMVYRTEAVRNGIRCGGYEGICGWVWIYLYKRNHTGCPEYGLSMTLNRGNFSPGADCGNFSREMPYTKTFGYAELGM